MVDFSCFVTLTYSDGSLPLSVDGKPTLEPKDLQNWLKRFRKENVNTVRFYACGEYGDDTFRPHYHVVLFGVVPCLNGMSRIDKLADGKSCCATCDLIQRTWGKGAIQVKALDAGLSDYIAGYVTKKMTSGDDPRLEGRHPEFARMSLRPGVGAPAIPAVAAVLKQYGVEYEGEDVIWKLDHGGKGKLLGRYLRERIRKEIGREKMDVLPEKFRLEMLALLEAQKSNPESSVKKEALKATEGRRASIKARYAIYNSKRPL